MDDIVSGKCSLNGFDRTIVGASKTIEPNHVSIGSDKEMKGDGKYSNKEFINDKTTVSVPTTPTTDRNHVPKAAEKESKRVEAKKGVIDYSRWDDLKVDDDIPTPAVISSADSNSETIQGKEKDDSHSKIKQKVEKKTVKNHNPIVELVASLRLKGNQLYKDEKYKEALEVYTSAIYTSINPPKSEKKRPEDDPFAFLDTLLDHAIPVDARLLTNRALCSMKLGEHQLCVDDCTLVLKDGDNAKAYWNRHLANFKLEKFEDSLSDLETLKGLDGADVVLVDRQIQMIKDAVANSQIPATPEFSISHFYKMGTSIEKNKLTEIMFESKEMKDMFRINGGFDQILDIELTSDSIETSLTILTAVSKNDDISQRFIASRLAEFMATLSQTSLSNITPTSKAILFNLLNNPGNQAVVFSKCEWSSWFGTLLSKSLTVPSAMKFFHSTISQASTRSFKNWLIDFNTLIPNLIVPSSASSQRVIRIVFELTLHKEFESIVKENAQILVDYSLLQLDKYSEAVLAIIHNILLSTPCHVETKPLVELFMTSATPLRLLVSIGKKNIIQHLTVAHFNRMRDLMVGDDTVIALLASQLESNSYLDMWKSLTGFSVLIDSITTAKEVNTIGNLALCLSHCASLSIIIVTIESNASELVKGGLMPIVVHLLRQTKQPKTRKNLGILCAKLSQDEQGKEIGRSMNALELLYGLK